MRSIVGASAERDDDFDASPPKRRGKAPASRGKPKITRAPRRAVEKPGFVARWMESFRNAMRWSAFWGALLLAFFFVVTVAGLFSGGHVSAALASVKSSADSIMAEAGFSVGSVIVDGRAETNATDISRVLGIKRGDLMLYVNVDEARARLEAMPWVKTAEVRRIWPSRIYVKIEERRPIARWQIDGVTYVIDADGKPIMGQSHMTYASLPLVVGRGAADAIGSFLSLVATQPNFKSNVKVAVRVGERRWDLQLANGVEVRLPEEGAEAALAELVKLDREQKILARDIKAIDLRFADRFIVKLPPGSPLIVPIKASGGRET
ncbi:MAG: cell division protein FtsQ/DivIB [Micropepsaceae bacterium]